MTAADVLATLGATGVALFLDAGRLRFRAAEGAYSDELRALVAAHREVIVAHLAGEQDRADAALTEVRRLLDRLARLAQGHRGRGIAVETFAGLTERWHQAGSPKLYELPEALGDLLRQWAECDRRSTP